jgi:hypothetical protein
MIWMKQVFPLQLLHRGGEIGNVRVAIERLNMFSERQYRRLSGVFSRHATFKMRQLRLFAAFRDRTRTAAPP